MATAIDPTYRVMVVANNGPTNSLEPSYLGGTRIVVIRSNREWPGDEDHT